MSSNYNYSSGGGSSNFQDSYCCPICNAEIQNAAYALNEMRTSECPYCSTSEDGQAADTLLDMKHSERNSCPRKKALVQGKVAIQRALAQKRALAQGGKLNLCKKHLPRLEMSQGKLNMFNFFF